MCDKGNRVLFTFGSCTVANKNSESLVRKGKRHKNIYKDGIIYSPENKLSCLSALDIDSFLWNKRLGHVSFLLLNKPITKGLVLRLPKSKFWKDKICDACAR